MATEIKIPAVGESVTEVQIGSWLKQEGTAVKQDEAVVTIESDKATVEINAPAAGVLSRVAKHDGDTAKVGEVIAYVDAAGAAAPAPVERGNGAAPAAVPAQNLQTEELPARPKTRVMPSAQRALSEHGLGVADVQPTGPGGRLLKEDVMRHLEHHHAEPAAPAAHAPAPAAAVKTDDAAKAKPRPPALRPDEEVVRMSPLRRTIAARLVEAQHNAALLTTFNEIDMSTLMALRKQHQETFQQRYTIKLGIMSFFVKAAVDALKLVPQVNAEVRGEEVIYRNYHDIGIAVGGGKGLVVPVLKDAAHMSFSQIERAIDDLGKRA